MTRTLDLVVPIEDRPFRHWQARVLVHSFERHRRPGQRLRFAVLAPASEPLSGYLARLFEAAGTPWQIVPPEHALARVLETATDLADDMAFLDPDHIFLKPLEVEGWPGWLRGRSEASTSTSTSTSTGAPWIAPVADWREIAPAWEREAAGARLDAAALERAALASGRRVNAFECALVETRGYALAPGETEDRPDAAPGAVLLRYRRGNPALEAWNFHEDAVDAGDGPRGAAIDVVLRDRALERLRALDRAARPATARALEAIAEALGEGAPFPPPPPRAPRPVVVGKLPKPLRRIARGEADPAPDPAERLDRDDPEARAFLDEMSRLVRLDGEGGAADAEVLRDAGGALALEFAAPGGICERSPVRAGLDAVVVRLAVPRPMAPLGEEGLRDALRGLLRLDAGPLGDGLLLGDLEFDRAVVYAEYRPSPATSLGHAVRKIIVWTDGNLLLAALKRRDGG